MGKACVCAEGLGDRTAAHHQGYVTSWCDKFLGGVTLCADTSCSPAAAPAAAVLPTFVPCASRIHTPPPPSNHHKSTFQQYMVSYEGRHNHAAPGGGGNSTRAARRLPAGSCGRGECCLVACQ